MKKGEEYWSQEEYAPKGMRDGTQLVHLQKTLNRVNKRVPFYREKFLAIGFDPEKDINSPEDLAKLPFTVKTDLRDNYPFGFCAAPMEQVARIHASSGTTGKPITGLYTKNDMGQWAECMARTLWAAGLRPDDLVQNALLTALFTGGKGFELGAEKIGCGIIPSGAGATERQIILIQDWLPVAIFATPSYALTIADKAEETNIDLKNYSLRVGVFGAEPWSNGLRREIEEKLGIVAFEAYGLTELMGPGVAFSCLFKSLHINEDHVYPEIINPETGETLPLGAKGELVLTSLQREAMPIIRYRTRDITALRREECSCGRTLITMDRVMHRSDDMKIVNGVNFYASQAEDILFEFEALDPSFYRITLKKKHRLDAVIIEVEARGVFQDDKKRGALEGKISEKIKETIGISSQIKVVPPGFLPRSEGKAKRLIDEREQK